MLKLMIFYAIEQMTTEIMIIIKMKKKMVVESHIVYFENDIHYFRLFVFCTIALNWVKFQTFCFFP